MLNRIREWFSIRLAKNPGQIVLLSILFFNVVFLLLSAFIISRMSLTGTEHLGFLQSAYYTISMILDAGGVAYVVEDIGPQNAAIAIVCLLIVIIGMISFTGAVIGYITNYISSFIESSNAGNHKLHVSGHFVILNWNSRALEIVNDMLYSNTCNKVVVLVGSGKEEVICSLLDELGLEGAFIQEIVELVVASTVCHGWYSPHRFPAYAVCR